MMYQIEQAELPEPQESRRPHRIENARQFDAIQPGQQAQIVIRPVNDQFGPSQPPPKRIQLQRGQGVDENRVSGQGQLHQA